MEKTRPRHTDHRSKQTITHKTIIGLEKLGIEDKYQRNRLCKQLHNTAMHYLHAMVVEQRKQEAAMGLDFFERRWGSRGVGENLRAGHGGGGSGPYRQRETSLPPKPPTSPRGLHAFSSSSSEFTVHAAASIPHSRWHATCSEYPNHWHRAALCCTFTQGYPIKEGPLHHPVAIPDHTVSLVRDAASTKKDKPDKLLLQKPSQKALKSGAPP